MYLINTIYIKSKHSEEHSIMQYNSFSLYQAISAGEPMGPFGSHISAGTPRR